MGNRSADGDFPKEPAVPSEPKVPITVHHERPEITAILGSNGEENVVLPNRQAAPVGAMLGVSHMRQLWPLAFSPVREVLLGDRHALAVGKTNLSWQAGAMEEYARGLVLRLHVNGVGGPSVRLESRLQRV